MGWKVAPSDKWLEIGCKFYFFLGRSDCQHFWSCFAISVVIFRRSRQRRRPAGIPNFKWEWKKDRPRPTLTDRPACLSWVWFLLGLLQSAPPSLVTIAKWSLGYDCDRAKSLCKSPRLTFTMRLFRLLHANFHLPNSSNYEFLFPTLHVYNATLPYFFFFAHRMRTPISISRNAALTKFYAPICTTMKSQVLEPTLVERCSGVFAQLIGQNIFLLIAEVNEYYGTSPLKFFACQCNFHLYHVQ